MKVRLPVVVSAEALQEVGDVARDRDGEDERDADPQRAIQVRIGPYLVEQEAALECGHDRAQASSDDVIGGDVEELLVVFDLPDRVLSVLEQALVHGMRLLECVADQQLE